MDGRVTRLENVHEALDSYIRNLSLRYLNVEGGGKDREDNVDDDHDDGAIVQAEVGDGEPVTAHHGPIEAVSILKKEPSADEEEDADQTGQGEGEGESSDDDDDDDDKDGVIPPESNVQRKGNEVKPEYATLREFLAAQGRDIEQQGDKKVKPPQDAAVQQRKEAVPGHESSLRGYLAAAQQQQGDEPSTQEGQKKSRGQNQRKKKRNARLKEEDNNVGEERADAGNNAVGDSEQATTANEQPPEDEPQRVVGTMLPPDDQTNYTGILKELGDRERVVPLFQETQTIKANQSYWQVTVTYGYVVGIGSGSSKKVARQAASKDTLDRSKGPAPQPNPNPS